MQYHLCRQNKSSSVMISRKRGSVFCSFVPPHPNAVSIVFNTYYILLSTDNNSLCRIMIFPNCPSDLSIPRKHRRQNENSSKCGLPVSRSQNILINTVFGVHRRCLTISAAIHRFPIGYCSLLCGILIKYHAFTD